MMELIPLCKTALVRIVSASLTAALLDVLLPESERGARKVIMLAAVLAVLSGLIK